jgi:hypothetical protein
MTWSITSPTIFYYVFWKHRSTQGNFQLPKNDNVDIRIQYVGASLEYW